MFDRRSTSNNSMPEISVILPVYNCPTYIGQAITSILQQTFENFELIIIDDGSTDNSPEIIQMNQDHRIRFVRQKNQGLAATLNNGIKLARGKYIARQDQDDLALPERFAYQVKYLDSHPDCGMVGTWAEIWIKDKKTERVHRHPSDNPTLQYELLFNNPFVHSSMMLRKNSVKSLGGYSTDHNRQPPEDYELWSRIARKFEVANIPEILQIYREIPQSMSRIGPSPFRNHLIKICAENIAWASGFPSDDPTPVNIAALNHYSRDHLLGNPDFRLMKECLNKAVEHISKNDARLEHEVNKKIQHLKNAEWSFRQENSSHKPIYFFIRAFHKIINHNKD